MAKRSARKIRAPQRLHHPDDKQAKSELSKRLSRPSIIGGTHQKVASGKLQAPKLRDR
jgi:hypothetical protein